jgi:hypothetical protein
MLAVERLARQGTSGKEASVLFGLVMNGRPGTLNERSARRMQWQPPEGVNVVGEYWFPTDYPSVVAIVEAEDTAAVAAIRLAWDDLFDIAAFPIVTAE